LYLFVENDISMTYYHKEITRIGNLCYSNKGQIATVIGTRHYINNNFDKELNLDLLSHIRFTSKFHLLRLFKRYYGQTPKQYLTDKRIEKAKELLAQGTNVTETCFGIGFDSPSSFSTLFKSRVGITPSEFQKRATFAKLD
jgi:AraC-like DNA-binding protein